MYESKGEIRVYGNIYGESKSVDIKSEPNFLESTR